MLDDLIARGLGNASKLLLWGDSAGAVGVWTNIDFINEYLPPAVDVAGVVNSGWFLPVIDLADPFVLFDPYLDSTCDAATNSSLNCVLNANFAYRHIESRLFTVQSVLDSFEIVSLLGYSLSPTYSDLLTGVGNYYLSRVSYIPSRPQDGWYVVSCYLHVLKLNIPYINGTTVTNAIDAWYFGGRAGGIADTCLANSSVAIQTQNSSLECASVISTCLQNVTLPVSSTNMASNSGSVATNLGSTALRMSTFQDESFASRLSIGFVFCFSLLLIWQ